MISLVGGMWAAKCLYPCATRLIATYWLCNWAASVDQILTLHFKLMKNSDLISSIYTAHTCLALHWISDCKSSKLLADMILKRYQYTLWPYDIADDTPEVIFLPSGRSALMLHHTHKYACWLRVTWIFLQPLTLHCNMIITIIKLVLLSEQHCREEHTLM